ncbi:related to STU2-Microtubule-associated protein (MAP) of the XMAP215/Dis1 family [Sporisorium reilianum f. sp. reilianum]|uniref:Related to STU2-Microtubule-associated protein (MAP) of the XMAP215/Dis1 family n=1 Tax=Sporisorium reilianum f. sp. reilianum TaxID=72559 RepID=A0A2N8UBI4_9BASI|nr:related to STU2-Microtubule-associated protein (MAP) of the XMAP215/Dis1 family [Sporisorium reilianum f. sp. reilianum]
MSMDMMGGAAPAEVDFTKMSIEERLASKLWKARVSAYEDLSKAFPKTSSENDPIFRQYTRNPDVLKAIVVDTNAVAQEKGVDAVCAFVEFGGQPAGKTREVVVPALIEKCLGSTRAGTKKNALELISFYAEMEDVVGCEPLLADLLDGLKAKQPKVVAGCIAAIKDLVRDFGHKQVSPKPILKRLPDMFAHSDKNVRAEASLLAHELHRYIGAALEPTIDSLKDIQAKELRQQFADIDAASPTKPVPTRFLLSQREKMQAAAAAPVSHSGADAAADSQAAGGSLADAQPEEDDVDPYDLAEPVNVFGSRDFPADFEEMIISKKWQERKETLETILKILTSSPKIQPDSRFDGLVDHLALKIQKDANINVVLVSCQCLEAMAKGLRDNFSRYKDKVVPPIIEKLKEKKPATVDVLAKALDAIFQTVSFSEILEHIFTGIKHKNPAVKTESIRFLVRCLRTTRVAPAKADIKPIGDALVTAMADGSPDVRDAGAAGLGTLMKLIGERPMNIFLDGLDDIKKGKVQDEYKTAEVKVKMGSAVGAGAAASSSSAAARRSPAAATASAAVNRAPPPAVVRAKPAPATPAAAEGKENQAPKPVARPPAGTAARLGGARPAAAASARRPAPTTSSAARPAAAAAAGGSKAAASATEPVKYRFHPDDAEARAADLIPTGIATQLASSAWKERLAGMTEFNGWLKIEAETVESEIIVRALGKKPGWKESNFQVMAEVYKALQLLANDCPTFARPSVALSVQPLCDKLGDIKLKTPAGETLVTFAEKTSFGFLLAQALGPLGALKAPKAIADSILWVDQTLLEFGTAGVDVRSLIDYLVTCLKSANAAVRTNATKAIGTLARFLGTALNAFLADLNPQLRTTIEAEIEKAASNPPPAPVRFSDETKAPAGKAAAGSGTGGASGPAAQDNGVDEDMLDELVPRVDLDRLLPATAIARMGDANWKERKEGLEEVLAVVNANSRLKGNMAELANALKMRCSDSNIMCKSMALDAIAKIATAMNKHFEPQARILAGPITQVLADAKAPVRASATTALTAIAEQVGAGPLLPGIATVVEGKAANPMLKQELFGWLANWFESHPPEKGMDLAPLALPCVQCLDDKLAAVRKASQACLPFIIMRAGYKHVMEQANQLKTASKNTAIPLIDAAKAQAQAAARASGAAATAPAPAAAASAPAPAARAMAASARGAAASPARAAGVGAGASSAAAPSTSSPRSSLIARPGGIKPPSAVGRSLKAPSSTIARSSRLASDGSDGAASSRNASASGNGAAGQGAGAAMDRSAPLISGDIKAKALREKREGKAANWIGADGAPRPELVEVLRQQCDGQLSRGVTDSMFSKSHSSEKDFYAALTLLSDFISSPTFAEEQYGLSPEETIERTLANSDLILKYVSIRLTDNNTSLSLKCLDILEHLVALLSTQQYHMSDYEAACILPCLTAKFGDAKVAFRDRIREIFRKMTFIYPPSKLLTSYLENGLPSKNARVRTECLSEVGYLFSKNGLQVCSPSRTLPVIAKQISDRDANVRTAALSAIGEAYKIIGDEVYKLVGALPGKEMSMLEERLKRTTAPSSSAAPAAKPAAAAAAAASGVGRAGPRASVVPSSAAGPSSPGRLSGGAPSSRLARPGSTMQPAAPSAGVRSRLPAPGAARRESAIGLPRATRSSTGVPSPRTSMLRAPSEAAAAAASAAARPTSAAASERDELLADELPDEEDDELSVDQAINLVVSNNVEQSVLALKHVEAFIREEEPQLIQHVDQLAIVLSKQMQRAFAPETGEFGNERLKKHLLVVSTSLFDKNRVWEDGRTLGSYLSRSALIPLLTVLLQQLIQSTSRTDDATAQNESKFLNVIVLRCFSACNLNLLYGACLQMLTEATEDLRELEGEVLETRSKFSELLVKCLWKIAKRLEDSLAQGQVEPQQLFADVESFLQAIAPSEWRQRAQDGVPLADLPLRTVKIILSHTSNHFGEEALGMLDMIPQPENSYVYKYLIRMLNIAAEGGAGADKAAVADVDADAVGSAAKSGSANGAAGNAAGHQRNGSQSGNGNGSGNSAVDDASSTHHAELRDIFQRISNKSESRQGIRELYEFQKRNPHLDKHVENSLQKTGPIFQRFIKRALANHAAEDPDVVSTTDAAAAPPAPGAAAGVEGIKRVSTPSAGSANGSGTPGTPRSARFSASTGAVGAADASMGSPTTSSATQSPRGSSIRSSATDDRLAQLRAKFSS